MLAQVCPQARRRCRVRARRRGSPIRRAQTRGAPARRRSRAVGATWPRHRAHAPSEAASPPQMPPRVLLRLRQRSLARTARAARRAAAAAQARARPAEQGRNNALAAPDNQWVSKLNPILRTAAAERSGMITTLSVMVGKAKIGFAQARLVRRWCWWTARLTSGVRVCGLRGNNAKQRGLRQRSHRS